MAEESELPISPRDLFEWIRHRNERDYGRRRMETVRRLGTELHPSATDVIAELVQNAEDCGATAMGFVEVAHPRSLLVWNNGARMSPSDVAAISGMLDSSKSEGSIGYFGIGFKSVLALTDAPQVYSGDYRFTLVGCLDPVAVDAADPPPAVLSRGDGDTVFLLPLRDGVDQTVVDALRNRVEADDMRLLFFLNGLKSIEWASETNEDVGFVSSLTRERNDDETSVLRTSEDDNDPGSWLLLRHSTKLSPEIADPIIASLEAAGSTRVARVRETVGKELWVQFALALEGSDGRGAVRRAEEGLLASGLPTSERTGLPFHLEGWIPLSISRAQAKLDDPLARWTLSNFAAAAAELPHRIRLAGKWDVRSLEAVPKPDGVAEPFREVADAFRSAVAVGEFFADEDGVFVGRDAVAIAHRGELYGVLEPKHLESMLGRRVRWVADELRQGRCNEVCRELGVREVGAADVLLWLRTFLQAGQPIDPTLRDWLLRLASYLVRLPAKDVLGLPILPTSCGLRPPSDSMLRPETSQLGEIAQPGDVPFVDEQFLADSRGRALVQAVQVRTFTPARLIKRRAEQLAASRTVTTKDAGELLALISAATEARHLSTSDLQELSGIEWLPTLGGPAAPSSCTLGARFGNEITEGYLRLVGQASSLVRPGVLEAAQERGVRASQVSESLQLLGCAQFVRPIKVVSRARSSDLRARVKACRINPTQDANSSSYKWELHEVTMPGLADLIAAWRDYPPSLSDANLVFRALAQQPGDRLAVSFDGAETQVSFGQAVLAYKYYSGRFQGGVATDLCELQRLRWLPDSAGVARRCSELVMPTVAEVLGSEAMSLHPSLVDKVEDDVATRAARLLGIQDDAESEAVINRLRTLRDLNSPGPEILYRRLAAQSEKSEEERAAVEAALKREALIWCGRYGWRSTDDLCWIDEGGLLPGLGDVWHSSLRTFSRRIGVADRPDFGVRARCLSAAPEWTNPGDPVVRKLVQVVDEDYQQGQLGPELLARLSDASCWPGRSLDGIRWCTAQQLVIDDDHRRSSSLAHAAPVWPSHEARSLLEVLGARYASQASPYLISAGHRESYDTDEDSVQLLRACAQAVHHVVVQIAPQHADALRGLKSIEATSGLEAGFRLEDVDGGPDPLLRSWCRGESLLVDQRRLGRLSHEVGDAIAVLAGDSSLRELVKDLWNARDSFERRVLIDEYCGEHRLVGPPAPETEEAQSRDEPGGSSSAHNGALSPSEVGERSPQVAARSTNMLSETSVQDHRARSLGSGTARWSAVDGERAWSFPSVRTENTVPGMGSGGGFSADVDAAHNASIERIAVDWVVDQLRDVGLVVSSVEQEFVGYDLLATLPSGAQIRIEVKGRTASVPTISLSRNEYETAVGSIGSGKRHLLVVVNVVDGEAVDAVVVDAATPGFAEAFTPSYWSAPGRWGRLSVVFDAVTFTDER